VEKPWAVAVAVAVVPDEVRDDTEAVVLALVRDETDTGTLLFRTAVLDLKLPLAWYAAETVWGLAGTVN
jgi:hypothetical protein